MQRSRPSTRTLAIFGLVVVGVVRSFAFHAALTDMSVTYTATAVQPGEGPSRVADASRHVVDLDERLRGKSVAVRRPIDRAATNGSSRGDVPPELEIILDDERGDGDWTGDTGRASDDVSEEDIGPRQREAEDELDAPGGAFLDDPTGSTGGGRRAGGGLFPRPGRTRP